MKDKLRLKNKIKNIRIFTKKIKEKNKNKKGSNWKILSTTITPQSTHVVLRGRRCGWHIQQHGIIIFYTTKQRHTYYPYDVCDFPTIICTIHILIKK